MSELLVVRRKGAEPVSALCFADVLSLDSCERDPLQPETVSFSLLAACAKLSQLNVEGFT